MGATSKNPKKESLRCNWRTADMAEARAAVDNIRVVGSLQLEAIVQRAKLRGPQAHTCNGGIVIVLPPPRQLLRLALYKSYNVYHHFQRACWPAPVWAVIAVLNVCIGHVMSSPQDSWFRSGPVAAMLWDADERFLGALGVSSLLPAYLRIAYLAGYSALACMLVVALVSKLSMRLLLCYRGWMFEKKPSLFTSESLALLSRIEKPSNRLIDGSIQIYSLLLELRWR